MPFLLLLIGLFSANVSAEQQWFARHSEGWFWYEPIMEPEKKKDESDTQNAKLQPLSSAWIRGNIGKYLDKAIDHPSKENVSNYYPVCQYLMAGGRLQERSGKPTTSAKRW